MNERPHRSGAARASKRKSRPTLPAIVGIGYVRVAATPQEAPRAGLDAQIVKIRGRAKAEGIELVCVVEESGESAYNLKRAGLTQLFRLLDAGSISVVIVADLSRLARDIFDLCRLLSRFARRGVALVTVQESLDTRTSQGRRELRALCRSASFRWQRP